MTVGVGVVGYGYWGANLARNVAASPGTDLVAVADATAAQREAATTTFPNVQITETLSELLANADVEAVIIATPASTHATAALEVLRSGRHVLVEKPLAMTPADAEAVVAAASEEGRILMVGHTFLYSAPVLRLRAYVDAGVLGDVKYLYSQRLSLGRIRRDCNAMWNFAPHDVSIMLYLLDEPVVSVSATGHSFIQPGLDDVCFASLTFASGVAGNLHVSWIDPRKTRTLTVVGDRQMAIYNDVSVDQKLWLVDAGVAGGDGTFGAYESLGDFQWRTRAGDITIPHIEMVEPLRAEIDAFAEACTTGVAPRTDGEHGLAVVRVLDAIDRSTKAGGAPMSVQS